MTRNTPTRLPTKFLLLSRVLLFLVGILITAIPWTERYCALDNFPQGQDVETNLLAFLALAGLMLLLAHLCHQAVAALFSLRCWICLRSDPAAHHLTGFGIAPAHRTPLPSPFFAAFSPPLQV